MSDYVTKEMVNKAMQVDLLEYARSLGMEFETRGSKDTLYLKGHSLNITRSKNMYYRFSTGRGGNVINFAMEQNGWSFQQAVRALCGEEVQKSTAKFTYTEHTKKNAVKEPMILPKANSDSRRAYAYLVKTRHIDHQIVSQLMREKKIYENEYHSCVFVGYDENGKPGYASMRSTNTFGKVYKGDVENSDKRHGFIINGKSDTVHVFEAPIDAMSHATIMKMSGCDWQEDWRISLGGFSDLSLNEFLKTHTEIKNIYFATDNDEQGRKILVNESDENGEITKMGYMQKYMDKGYEVFREEPLHKDFNEDLCVLCEEVMTNEEELCL